ncbi:hypothetical protein H8S90_08600 [Olivibacter sp. SDN3]|uniref:hypothetical protein n=1 Tax=Olivibacter sp. SDN3 TaxID=2764720 RepID=UPI001651501E|nr:hypothetical protein [Olivibacter sp. SDN3]QNL51615.1 hypothetical protein H8S90_08600 [Olivibacter sp. SDN3]
MKNRFLLLLTFAILLGCTKDDLYPIPIEITLTSNEGALEIHYAPNKIDTLLNTQGTAKLTVMENDVVRIRSICKCNGKVQYNIKSPTFSHLSFLLAYGDENMHRISNQ